MKKDLQKMLRKVLAFSLSMAMVCGLVQPAYATTSTGGPGTSDPTEPLNYVSLGDSMTNGYGLDGYRYNDNEQLINVNGYLQKADNAYPSLFKEYLADKYDQNVDLIQLAMSGMRAEEVYYLLTYGTDKEFYADEYTKTSGYSRFNDKDINRFDKSGVENVSTKYKESIAKANVISIGLGYNNFGTFLTQRLCYEITQMGFNLGGAHFETDLEELLDSQNNPELTSEAMKMYDELMKIMDKQLVTNGVNDEKMVHFCESMVEAAVYSYVGFVISYDGILKYIAEVNPTAKVMIVGMTNSLNGMVLSVPGVGTIDMGEYFGYLTKSANLYMAGLPAAYDLVGKADESKKFPLTVLYAEPGNVELFISDIAKGKYNGAALLHERVLEKTIDMIFPLIGINSSIELSDVSKVESILSENTDLVNLATAIQKLGFDENKLKACVAYIGIEDAIEDAAKIKSIDFNAITALMDKDLLNSIFQKAMETYEKSIQDTLSKFDLNDDQMKSIVTMQATPAAMKEALNNDTINALLHMFARFLVGDGIGCHPNANGYKTIYNAMTKAYDENITASDYVSEEIVKAIEFAQKLVTEYYDEAYAYGYQYATEKGIIDAADKVLKSIDLTEVKEWIENNKAYMSEEFYNELKVAVADVEETIKALNDLIINADVLDGETYTKAMALVNALNTNLNDLVDLIETAGTDAGNAAWDQLVIVGNKLWDEWLETKAWLDENLPIIADKAIEYIADKAEEALKELAVATKEAIAKYAPEVADAVYNYLYNNPEKVIAFVNEYGPLMIDLLNEYGDEILGFLGYIAVNYGEDIAKYVIENHEVILKGLNEWLDKHGENTWELILVYINALGLDDLVGKSLEEIKDAIKDINSWLEDKADDIYNELMDQLDSLKGKLEDLQDKLEDLQEQLKDAAEDAKDKINAAIKDVEKAIEAVKDQINSMIKDAKDLIKALVGHLSDSLNQKLEDLENKLEDLKDALVSGAQDKINAAIKAVEDAINAVKQEIRNILDNIYNGVMEDLNSLKDKLEDLKDALVSGAKDKINAAIKDVEDLINELAGKVSDSLREKLENLEDKLEDLKDALVSGAQDKINAAIKEVEKAAAAVVEEIKDILADIYEDATHADYVVNADSYYVSIGDASAIATEEGCEDSYAVRLAKELGLNENQVSELAAAGLRAEDIRAILDASYTTDEYGNTVLKDIEALRAKYISEIAKADLITVNFGNNTTFVTEQMYRAIRSKTTYAMDWENYVTADGIKYVEEILAEIETEVANLGLDTKISKTLMVGIESYLYSYVGFATNYPVVLEAIHTINPEAQVVLVGAYNPLENAVIEMNGAKLDISKYFDQLVKLTDAAYLATTVLTENTIYVEAKDVETILEAEDASYEDKDIFTYVIALKEGDTLASCKGHEYIKDQILNALNVIEDDFMLGDVDNDGDVDGFDSVLLDRYNAEWDIEINLLAADIDQDGDVDGYDSVLLDRYNAGWEGIL